MNGNSWQRMGQFARFPGHDLGPVSQPPAGGLFPVGELMGGGGIPASAMMPQQQMPRQQIPQQYGQGQPQGKKILGMPKDRFIALMGTIAQAFGGDSASGRMGAGLVNMADIMHGERVAQGEQQTIEAEARRKAATELAKEKRTATAKERERKEKVPSEWEATYKEMRGKINPETKAPYTIGEIRAAHKKVGAKKPTTPKGQAGFNEVNGVLHKGFWHLDTDKGEYIFAPTRKATEAEKAKTKVKPPAEKEPMTEAKARKGIVDIAKYRQKLKTSGGMDETLFYLIQKNNPDLAKEMQGADRDNLEVVLGEHEKWLKTFIPGAKKAKSFGSSDAPEGATATNPTTGEKIITKNGEWVLSE